MIVVLIILSGLCCGACVWCVVSVRRCRRANLAALEEIITILASWDATTPGGREQGTPHRPHAGPRPA